MYYHSYLIVVLEVTYLGHNKRFIGGAQQLNFKFLSTFVSDVESNYKLYIYTWNLPIWAPFVPLLVTSKQHTQVGTVSFVSPWLSHDHMIRYVPSRHHTDQIEGNGATSVSNSDSK